MTGFQFLLRRMRFILPGCLIFLVACTPPKPILITGNTMGTTYSVKVVDPVDQQKLAASIKGRLAEINDLMSTYIPASEISRINQLAVGDSMPISAENVQMLELAKTLHRESAGRFDVTIGPLISLWGFGPDPSRTSVPPEEEIAAAIDHLGLDGLKVEAGQVTKVHPVEVSFSAIAKGYGVDEIARLVEAAGAANYLVEIGGELRAKGRNSQDQIWRIGIEKPDVAERSAFTAIPLDGLAMATSGDYRNYFEVDGIRYSHTLDPTTGYPITHTVASVTVLAETAAIADGYATAINVMGAEAGLALANEKNLPVFVILKVNSEFTTRSSQAFEAYMVRHQG